MPLKTLDPFSAFRKVWETSVVVEHSSRTTLYLHVHRRSAYPVYIGGQRSERVDHNEMFAGKGVDEGAAIPLSQDMQYTGLVQVYQVDNVLHFIQTLGVCLGGRRGEGRGRQGEEEMRKRNEGVESVRLRERGEVGDEGGG